MKPSRKRRKPCSDINSHVFSVARKALAAHCRKLGVTMEVWLYDKDPNAENIRPSRININKPALAYKRKGSGPVFFWHAGGRFWFTQQ